MKRKITAFFAILAIATVSAVGLSVNAATYVTEDTSTIFISNAQTSVTKVAIKTDKKGHVQAVKSADQGNYKFVEMVTFKYLRGTGDNAEFSEIDYGYNQGTATDVSAYADLGGATNVYVKGMIYEAVDSHSSIKEELVLNVRQNKGVPYLTKKYY